MPITQFFALVFPVFPLDFPFLIFSLHQKNPYTHHFFRLAKLKLDPCLFHNFLQVDSHGFRGKTPELRLYAFYQVAPLAFVAGTWSEQMGKNKAFPKSFLFQLEHITEGLFLEFSPGFEDILHICSITFFHKEECIFVF